MVTSIDGHATEEWGGRLTPSDVHHVLFTRAGLGRRGYDEVEVDVFLERVQQELTRLVGEKAVLREEVSRLTAQLAQGVSGPESASAGDVLARGEAQLQAVRLLAAAQQTADAYVVDAEDYSRRLTVEAREQSQQMLMEARQAAQRMLAEAERLASETPRTTGGEVLLSSRPGKEGLDRQVAHLETFAQVVRVQLRAYLQALLRDVDEGWSRDPEPGLAVADPGADLTSVSDSSDGTDPPAEDQGAPSDASADTAGPDAAIDLSEQGDGGTTGTHARTRKRTTVTLHSR